MEKQKHRYFAVTHATIFCQLLLFKAKTKFVKVYVFLYKNKLGNPALPKN